jgi:uncharacterized protein
MSDDCWIQTVSGRDVDLLNPKPESILLGDIVYALAKIPRFIGHTIGRLPWSVAQHSMLVESLLPESSDPLERLYALLHDAHEAYVGDIVSPLKRAMDAIWKSEQSAGNHKYVSPPSNYLRTITGRLDIAIFTVFDLHPTSDTMHKVHVADMLALRVEADLLMATRKREWVYLSDPPDPMPSLQLGISRMEVMKLFVDRFNKLQSERHKIKRLLQLSSGPQ